jgi:DNA-binding XRE family transcriptional regulator
MNIRAFQLRAARSVTGLGVREIGAYCDVSRTTISSLELLKSHKILKLARAKVNALIFLFEQYNIFFPDEDTVKMKVKQEHYIDYLSRFQFRAGRSILQLTQAQVGSFVDASFSRISKIERTKNENCVSIGTEVDISLCRAFFEGQGLIFPEKYTISFPLKQN